MNATHNPMSTARPGLARQVAAEKFLSFHLGKEEYAIPVLDVAEIIGLQDVTPVPHVPPCIKGVINLRGKVTPIIDLRVKFRLPEALHTRRTCIVVVQLREQPRRAVGLIVDSVSDVANIAKVEIEETAALGLQVELPYLAGVARTKDRVRLLLHVGALVTPDEFASLATATSLIESVA